MIIRIVRLTFRPDRVETFLSIFDESAPFIRDFPGCRFLELLQDADRPNVLTSLSHWEHDDALQRYRASDLFRDTWSRTKPLFAGPPEASSLHRIRSNPA